jgi:hypothetical protein
MRKIAIIVLLLFANVVTTGQIIFAPNSHQPSRRNVCIVLCDKPFGTLTAEYERAQRARQTAICLSCWYKYKNIKFRWFNAKLEYCPLQNVFSRSGPMADIMFQYNSMFGKKKTLHLGESPIKRIEPIKMDRFARR